LVFQIKFLLQLILVFLISTSTTGCVDTDYAFIQISSLSTDESLKNYDDLFMEVSDWPEFKFVSKRLAVNCEINIEKNNRKIDGFSLDGNSAISVTTILNKETNLVILRFNQIGGFNKDGDKIFEEITKRIKTRFGEKRVVLLTDINSGKYKMADFLESIFKEYKLCK
jgi:hypothetical protein